MNVPLYRIRNWFHKAKDRLMHPPPLYKKSGGIGVIVTRKDGRKENLKNVATTYTKRWGVGSGQQ